jgi:hypothetical protein
MSSKIYNIELRNQIEYASGGTKTQIQISRKNKKNMTFEEIKKLYEKMMEEAHEENENIDIVITGLNIQKWTTLKGFGRDMISLEDFDDYYVNSVKDDSPHPATTKNCDIHGEYSRRAMPSGKIA